MPTDRPLRTATPADIPVLARHRRLMFEEMARLNGLRPDPEKLGEMEALYTGHLRNHLPDGSLRAWIAEQEGQVVASGALSLLDWPATPSNLCSQLGLLHSVYTLPAYRRRGLAHAIAMEAIEFGRQAGLKRLVLHASEAGRPLYISLGFKPADNEMRLALD